jgi:hypothetical protein
MQPLLSLSSASNANYGIVSSDYQKGYPNNVITIADDIAVCQLNDIPQKEKAPNTVFIISPQSEASRKLVADTKVSTGYSQHTLLKKRRNPVSYHDEVVKKSKCENAIVNPITICGNSAEIIILDADISEKEVDSSEKRKPVIIEEIDDDDDDDCEIIISNGLSKSNANPSVPIDIIDDIAKAKALTEAKPKNSISKINVNDPVVIDLEDEDPSLGQNIEGFTDDLKARHKTQDSKLFKLMQKAEQERARNATLETMLRQSFGSINDLSHTNQGLLNLLNLCANTGPINSPMPPTYQGEFTTPAHPNAKFNNFSTPPYSQPNSIYQMHQFLLNGLPKPFNANNSNINNNSGNSTTLNTMLAHNSKNTSLLPHYNSSNSIIIDAAPQIISMEKENSNDKPLLLNPKAHRYPVITPKDVTSFLNKPYKKDKMKFHASTNHHVIIPTHQEIIQSHHKTSSKPILDVKRKVAEAMKHPHHYGKPVHKVVIENQKEVVVLDEDEELTLLPQPPKLSKAANKASRSTLPFEIKTKSTRKATIAATLIKEKMSLNKSKPIPEVPLTFALKTTGHSRRKNKLQLKSEGLLNEENTQLPGATAPKMIKENMAGKKMIQPFIPTNSRGMTKAMKSDSFDTIKPRFTKVGSAHQAKIPELIINRASLHSVNNSNGNYLKIGRVKWTPDKVDTTDLKVFFGRLKTILGCSFINHEKAIKLLHEKTFDTNATIDMIKEDESHYSNLFKVKKLKDAAKRMQAMSMEEEQ